LFTFSKPKRLAAFIQVFLALRDPFLQVTEIDSLPSLSILFIKMNFGQHILLFFVDKFDFSSNRIISSDKAKGAKELLGSKFAQVQAFHARWGNEGHVAILNIDEWKGLRLRYDRTIYLKRVLGLI